MTIDDPDVYVNSSNYPPPLPAKAAHAYCLHWYFNSLCGKTKGFLVFNVLSGAIRTLSVQNIFLYRMIST